MLNETERKICSIPGCGPARRIVRGWCYAHYERWKRYGDPEGKPPGQPTLAERFWPQVTIGEPDDCWPWTGTTTEHGYGRFYVSAERGHAPTHVVALELENGEPCPPGRQGNHTCDNPPCCNPRHVYWGTQTENCDDMTQRDRRVKGSRHQSAKLDEADIPVIRRRLAAGELQRVIGSDYGVHQVVIGKIKRGVTWRHVP